jgi:dTDP-D-glucose 4,6-dehydratase
MTVVVTGGGLIGSALVQACVETGGTQLIAGRAERRNIEVVCTICRLLDERRPDGAPHERLVAFVRDRPEWCRRTAADCAQERFGLARGTA